MKQVVKKLKAIEKELSGECGEFSVFGLFLREDATDRWDVVVAASWIYKNEKRALKVISDKLTKKLDQQELVSISRIVIIEKGNSALDELHSAIHVKHGDFEIRNSSFFGLQIKHAFLITSQRESTGANPKHTSSTPSQSEASWS